MSRKKQKQPHNRSPTQMNSMNSMSKIIINNLFWIKINFRSSMQLALLALRVRKKTIYSSYFLLNKHAHIHTQCKKWKRNGMEVHVHAEKKDGKKLKLRQFFIDASDREREMLNNNSQENFTGRRRWKLSEMEILKNALCAKVMNEKKWKRQAGMYWEREREIDKARKENCENC